MRLFYRILCMTVIVAPLRMVGQLKTFTLSQTLEIVKQFHPIAKQSNLLLEQAKAGMLMAQGGFDPSLFMSQESKTFDGKQYYQTLNPEIKLPLWFGVELKGGTEQNMGKALSTELTPGRSSYLGISVPVMKDLLFDKRRADLQISKTMLTMSKDQRQLLLNDLLLDATASYWNWVRTFQNYQNIKVILQRTAERLENIKRMVANGDRAAIDTLEAQLQWQTVSNQYNQCKMEWAQSTWGLSNFLWDATQQPYVLDSTVQPDASWLELSPVLVANEVLVSENEDLSSHPKIKMMASKMDILKIEKRLKVQSLLPSVKLQYNFLNKGYFTAAPTHADFLSNNYKAGIQLSVPLLQRQARGSLQQANIKIQDQQWEQSQTTLEITNKIRSYRAEVNAYLEQLLLQQTMELQYEKLFELEEQKFKLGESSLFVLNTREVKWIEAQQKTVELRTKLYKSIMALKWARGLTL